MHRFFKTMKQLVLTVLLLVLLALLAAGGYFAVEGHRLYQKAAENRPVAAMYGEISGREDFVSFRALPTTYVNAVIATEDERFERHRGVDPLSILRALWTDLRTGSLAEGGSTITQHLARKAAEMFAALEIEKQYDKEEILEMYVNTIYFGSGYYGIAEAAQGYFGKSPAELTDAEAVMLAGLPNAPSAYSPNSSPELALRRTQVVLRRMVSCHKLTRQQADDLAAQAAELRVLPAQ